ncbi:recombinational DNA repair ATPase RecF [Nocardioides luteus]|uniref:Nuclease SbcCD subunit C n=1 Tax=Nocardioides luteus TaxID=1844 RepID=A0ABQ5T1Y6_9ACTN|nr:ATP-binding protein [Nocardioides luteus]MDR7310482.1 recombinational DNA repair ATPase RecF [Nocardioides luteus]GGR73699.1 hypothetical protein GCM10010197_46230 [Nocardioides luteus]GLJ69737.1 hypothetical protein GCM10017579_37730 [Nocardioides luteus]
MSTELMGWVKEQVAASGLDEPVGQVVLAATVGPEALDAYLDYGTAPDVDVSAAEGPSKTDGTFLTSVEVEGFRGIGETTQVNIAPRPGLTIIAGRNGSGKSSMAEALELVLTGSTYRWAAKSSSIQWSERWRNLHHQRARIRVDAVEEGHGPISITATWPDTATTHDQYTTVVQRHTSGRPVVLNDLADLGWAASLEQYRPMPSYDELGGLLESGQSKLYDALASILGVQQITDAWGLVKDRLKQRKAPLGLVDAQRKSLQKQAAQLTDDRAITAATLLRKTAPDSAALRALATGTQTLSGPLAELRSLAIVEFPHSIGEVRGVADRIRAAITGLASVADDAAGLSQRELARLELLEQAITVHSEHGDMTCPVCRQGSLDAAWAATSRELAAQRRQQAQAYDLARQTLDLARSDLRKILTPRPRALQSAPTTAVAEAIAAARTSWERFIDIPPGDGYDAALAEAQHIEQQIENLLPALADLRAAVSSEIERLDDAWQPLASQIATWCDAFDAASADKPIIDRLTAAEKWLKENDLRLKNERLAPITDGAKHAWSKLRQESNIEIGNLQLAGTSTRRRVQIDAAIDGTPTDGIPVLSQGELHALALSLFIPRATMASSPFRFLILDDPIQAMDPAKVDGLVDLLGEIAATRQVIVLSHDDRLPAAVRRSSIDATILEVSRTSGSKVKIRTHADPAKRYLSDAFAMITAYENHQLADAALRRTLPGMLRFALEAAAKDRYFSRAVANGEDLHKVEGTWAGAETTRKKVGLAVFGEPRSHNELAAWATPHHRKFGLINAGVAMHEGLRSDVDPKQAAKTVERLIADVRDAS